jgi:NAD(P)-dependent dehydrogenase (short-subunit alcohol dehydrogenase family)
MEDPVLADKVVIVTGAGRGIGRAVALAAAREGASVVVNDPGMSLAGEHEGASPAGAVVEEIAARGGAAVANHESVADRAGASRIVDAALHEFGRLDAVVNSAGILRDRMFHKLAPEDWHAVIQVHLAGTFYVSRAAAPHFREREAGSFVHLTSPSGLVGNVGQANYASAKLGVVGLSTSIALDMRRFGVRSNCVAPFAWSRMTDSIPATDDAQRRRVAALRGIGPETVAPLVLYLASDLARDVNGQVFGVRNNELFVYSLPRPVASVHRDGGWSPRAIAEHGAPALRGRFTPLQVSAEVFSWDPI